MNFTTPYDYLGLIGNIFSIESKITEKIKTILNFSYTIPELTFNSAEEIFFGSILMAY